MKRRSAARTSVSSPRARQRGSGSSGSARVQITRRICSGRWSTSRGNTVVDRLVGEHVVVVEDEDQPFGLCPDLVEQVRQQRSRWAAARARPGRPRRRGRAPGRTLWMARRMQVQKRTGSSSSASSDSQAARVGGVRQPVPEQRRLAGAGRGGDQDQAVAIVQAAVQHASSRGRTIQLARGRGRCSLVAWMVMAAALRSCREGAVRGLYYPAWLETTRG